MARGIDWHLQDLKGERERYNGFRCICGLAVPQEPRLSNIPRNSSVVVAGGFQKLHASLVAFH